MKKIISVVLMVLLTVSTFSMPVKAYDRVYLGEFLISHYCPCSICCGWENGPTASGVMPEVGITIAASGEYDFGTKMQINGHVYTVQDRGGAIQGNRIDIFCESHQQALEKGIYYTDVYLVNGNQIVDYANQFIGNPFLWGGNSLTEGCDCSHFVWNVLRDTGYYDGEYVTSDGFLGLGESVEGLENAAAGDIVVYPGHVAIYDGEGKIIEAQSSSAGITNMREVSCNSILGIRRFSKDRNN